MAYHDAARPRLGTQPRPNAAGSDCLGGRMNTNRRLLRRALADLLVVLTFTAAAQQQGDPLPFTAAAQQQGDPLPSWNDGPTKAQIVAFVRAGTDPASPAFVPAEERIATFDNDGTLWVEK